MPPLDDQRYSELRQDIKDSLGEVKQAIHDLREELRTDYVSRAEYIVTVAAMEKAIDDIRRANRWGLDKAISIATPTVIAAAAFVAGQLVK